jgi:hypothetical protein
MLFQLLFGLTLAMALIPGGHRSVATDISGTWNCVIDQKDEDGPMSVTFVFKQEGEKLSGTYSDNLQRDAALAGTVKGDKLTFSWEIKPPAGMGKRSGVTVIFTGRIESPNRMVGDAGRPFCDACKWTATRKKK